MRAGGLDLGQVRGLAVQSMIFTSGSSIAAAEGLTMKRKFSVAAFALCSLLCAPFATAAEPDESQPEASKKLRDWALSGNLEIPGVTACHQCEWRPKPHQMHAADHCGVGPDGQPKLAEFECGFSEDCQRVCNFVRCVTP